MSPALLVGAVVHRMRNRAEVFAMAGDTMLPTGVMPAPGVNVVAFASVADWVTNSNASPTATTPKSAAPIDAAEGLVMDTAPAIPGTWIPPMNWAAVSTPAPDEAAGVKRINPGAVSATTVSKIFWVAMGNSKREREGTPDNRQSL